MSNNPPNKSMIMVGSQVEINPRSDRTRKVITTGVVKEILTNVEQHPHGILVMLNDGEVGRVRSVLSVEICEIDNKDAASFDVDASCEEIISSGENHFVEFKTSCLWSQSLDKLAIQKRGVEQYGVNTSKVIIAKSLAGFLNADGGDLVIGVKELKDSDKIEVIGIDSELHKLKDKTLDGYRRMLLDFIVKKYFPSFVFNRINDYIRISFSEINGVNICRLRALRSKDRVFLRLNSEDVFVVRIDASTRQIVGEDMVEYCVRRFK